MWQYILIGKEDVVPPVDVHNFISFHGHLKLFFFFIFLHYSFEVFNFDFVDIFLRDVFVF